MNTHKTKVKRSTRGYQMGAVAMLIAAGAAVALPLGDLLGPKPAPKAAVVTGGGAIEQPKAPLAMSLDEAAGVLTRVIAWKPEPEAPSATKPDDAVATAATTPATVAASGEWSYLGSVLMESASRALVRVDTSQHMLKPGSELNGTKLIEVEPRFITVETNGQRKQIELAARTNVFPTEPPKKPGGPLAAGLKGPGGGPSVAMTQNGMGATKAPASFDQMRQKAEEEAKRRAMAAPPVRPTPMNADALREQELKEKILQDPASIRDQYEKTLKSFGDPGLGTSERMDMLRNLGIQPGQSPEQAAERFRAAGINPDEHPDLMETLKENSKGTR